MSSKDQGAIHGKGKTTKGSSSLTAKAVDTATSAGNKGQKCKNDLTQQDQDGSYKNPPAKRGKALPAAEQWTHPVPCPVQKNTKHLEDPDKPHIQVKHLLC